MFKRKLIESLKSVINSLEDENKILKHDNQILLENSIELRRRIKGYENILEAEVEKQMQEKEAKKRGRKAKKEAE